MKLVLALAALCLTLILDAAHAVPARPLYVPLAIPTSPPVTFALAGTTWQGRLFTDGCQITFNADGRLIYLESGNKTPGSWRLEGNKLTFDINMYSEYDTTVIGDLIQGTGRNKAGMQCEPILRRISAEFKP